MLFFALLTAEGEWSGKMVYLKKRMIGSHEVT